MNTLNAIETIYKNVRFRSRAEARWAVFFDELKVRWFYEYEGFELKGGRYVPDFWLPDTQGGHWLEVKGAVPTMEEARLCGELTLETGYPCAIVWGEMGAWIQPGYDLGNLETYARGGSLVAFEPSWPSRCGKKGCGKFGFVLLGEAERLCSEHWEPGRFTLARTQAIIHAYDVALSYRFWDRPHGRR